MCLWAVLINKEAIDWDFIPEVKASIKDVIELEVKHITKFSLKLRL